MENNKIEFNNINRDIGVNSYRGAIYGGIISSYSDELTNDNVICINSGFDKTHCKIGDFSDAYDILKKNIKDYSKLSLENIGDVVFDTVWQYFGGIDNINERLKYFPDIDDEEELGIGTLSSLKGQDVAMCVERASLAHNLFKDPECKYDTILAFSIPNCRAFMHLDTVFTQVDYDKFTYHPGIMDTLQVFEITEGVNGEINVKEMKDSLQHILTKYIGKEVTLIPCGAGDKIISEREQWNDGSNTLCIAPGVVVVYDRNNVTNEVLRRAGLKVLEIEGAELSRGRGGPRCMSMPLYRED